MSCRQSIIDAKASSACSESYFLEIEPNSQISGQIGPNDKDEIIFLGKGSSIRGGRGQAKDSGSSGNMAKNVVIIALAVAVIYLIVSRK